MKPSIPLLGLHCIVDPDGNLIFTHLGTKPDECIKSWLDEERMIKGLILGRVTPSWEVYEADGYRLTTVDLIESKSEEIPEVMDLNQLSAFIFKKFGAECIIGTADFNDGSCHSILSVNEIQRAEWKGRLVNKNVPRDGITPRGPREYYDFKLL